MGWIKERIEAEKRKHGAYGADWAQIAECKIRASIKAEINGLQFYYKEDSEEYRVCNIIKEYLGTYSKDEETLE